MATLRHPFWLLVGAAQFLGISLFTGLDEWGWDLLFVTGNILVFAAIVFVTLPYGKVKVWKPSSLRKITIRQVVCGAAFAFGIYLLAYWPLSAFGGYRLKSTGQFRPTGLAIEDAFVWQPRFGVCVPFHTALETDTYWTDVVGRLYFPLTCLQQKYFHPTRPYLIDTGKDWKIGRWPPFETLHPETQRLVLIADGVNAKHKKALDAAKASGDKAKARKLRDDIRKEIEVAAKANS